MPSNSRLVFTTSNIEMPHEDNLRMPSASTSRSKARSKQPPSPSAPPSDEGSPLFEPEEPDSRDVTSRSQSRHFVRSDPDASLYTYKTHVGPTNSDDNISAHGYQVGRSHAGSTLFRPQDHSRDYRGSQGGDFPDQEAAETSHTNSVLASYHDQYRASSAHSEAFPDEEDIPHHAHIVHPQPIRYTYRDLKGVLREIWQPGDSDGKRDDEFADASIATIKSRLRFLQHDFGPIIRGVNSPPKHVILDDTACYEIGKSHAYTGKEKFMYWSHDFSQHGTIRNGRLNCGREVLMPVSKGGMKVDIQDSCGAREVAWAIVGPKKAAKKYPFSGERNGYKGVQFAIPEIPTSRVQAVHADPARTSKKRLKTAEEKEQDYLLNNPPKTPRHKKPRISAYLRATPSPQWPQLYRRERERMYSDKIYVAAGGRIEGAATPFHTAYGRVPHNDSHTSYPGNRTTDTGMDAHYSAYSGGGGHNTSYAAGSYEPSQSAGDGRTSQQGTVAMSHSPAPSGNQQIYHGYRQARPFMYEGVSFNDLQTSHAGDRGAATPYRDSHASMNDTLPSSGSTLWQAVRELETMAANDKKRLRARDEEIAALRSELKCLRQMHLEKGRSVDHGSDQSQSEQLERLVREAGTADGEDRGVGNHVDMQMGFFQHEQQRGGQMAEQEQQRGMEKNQQTATVQSTECTTSDHNDNQLNTDMRMGVGSHPDTEIHAFASAPAAHATYDAKGSAPHAGGTLDTMHEVREQQSHLAA